MGVCPKCAKPIEAGIANCPACGFELPKTTGTLDAESFFDGTAQPVDESATPDAGATVPEALDAAEIQTPEAAQDIQPAGEQAKGTLGMPEISDSTEPKAKVGAPKVPSEEARIVLDETIDSVELPPADAAATVRLDGEASEAREGTQQYGEKELSAAQKGNGGSGTAGRLKRLWGGAAGSSQNPMHTLKGEEALATDSVFAQVARRVLVTDTAIEIADSVGSVSASQPDKKKRVQECISVACEGADMDAADYDLTGFLGQGGMGVVLKARQRAIGRDVAIKMIQPSGGKSTASSTNAQKKKFFYEAQITGKLDHPNIVPIYELGISNEVLFYSMKMIIGKEWKEVIESNSRDENLDILMKVADAMAFAHQRRVIHRDLKPENVMLGTFGEVLVTDWGCAVDLSRKESFTGAGSPPWMSPEMADHNQKKIGPRSDIYLLGAILYQIISGYPPHPGQTVFECIEAAQKNVIIPLKVEDPLLDIALRAMETNPDDRFENVEAMQDAIREYRQHAESITLTDRSEALLTQAIQTKDYERFSRTIFGFQDAVELWPANSAAASGLAAARLAYGQCAYGKGDYDLCLQSLDKSVPAEAELYAKAEKAKKVAEERESRFKTLRKALAAVILIGLIAASLLASVAWYQRGKAVLAQKAAEQSAAAEKVAKEEAVTALTAAREARDAETTARIAADDAAKKEKLARMAADDAAEKEKIARMAADDATQAALEAAAKEKIARMAADEAAIAEKAAKEEAQQRTAQVELGAYQSKLALSLGQVQQRDVGSADSGLKELTTPDTYQALIAQGNLPKFDNWALNRVKLLSNSELLGSDSLGRVTAVAFAQNANIGVVAAEEEDGTGKLQIVELQGNKPHVLRAEPTPVAVVSASISPNGDEVVYSLKNGGKDKSAIFKLNLQEANSQPAKVAMESGDEGLPAGSRLQAFVMTEDKVVGGINGGLWVWTRNGNWQTSAPTQISSVRGQLRSMQLLDANRALVLAQLDGKLNVHVVNLSGEDNGSVLTFNIGPESEFDKDQLSAIAHADGKLILGTARGRLFTAELSANNNQVGPEFKEILPQMHRSAIESIRVHADGKVMLTTAAEPVVNVWKSSDEQLAGWQFDTDLAGTPENVGGASFMNSSSLVLGVGENGSSIVWDIPRQKQRQRLQRIDANGRDIAYESAVVNVVTSSDNQRAISIHADGTVDEWNLITGETLSETSVPEDIPSSIDVALSYVGHSPGASFVDMAIDEQAGILVTSAMLPLVETRTIKPAPEKMGVEEQLRTWEMCKWDTQTGKMLDRWTVEATNRQDISLARGGELILYASNNATIIKQAQKGGQAVITNDKLGSYFGVVHPKQENLMMTVKSNGSPRMVDTNRPDGGLNTPGFRVDYDDPKNTGLRSDDEIPLVGQWAPAGDRFYLLWESGRITELLWENSKLSKGRDLQGKELADLDVALTLPPTEANGKPTKIRLASRWQVDMKVRSKNSYNLLYIGIRYPGAEGRMRLARFAFPQGDGDVIVAKDEQVVGRPLLLTDAEEPEFELPPVEQLALVDQDIVATRTHGEHRYLATRSGTVYQVSASGESRVFGTPETLAGCGNAEANRVVTLHHGGVLWRADLTAGVWTWTPMQKAPVGAQDITMSPDGTRLLIRIDDANGSGLLIADAATGDVVESIADVQCGAWNAAGELVIVTGDGTVKRHQGAELGKVAQGKVRSLHFFAEPFSDATAKASEGWVLVHSMSDATDAETTGQLHFFNASDPTKNPTQPAEVASDLSVLACSPTDGIFVVGGKGTVQVHFAAPSLNQLGEDPLFSLEGHAGADIESLTFSVDGQTLISTDSSGRLFGWLSSDKLNGVSSSAVSTQVQ
ncbi:MAG: protein kinase [Pirellulaceae bacterium]